MLIGIVVIGRNEGERLVDCLTSLVKVSKAIVYVDSGSTDKSRENAQSLGVKLVELPMDRPFTAGRARNLGASTLLSQYPDMTYIQFLDGDCQLSEGWLETAVNFLDQSDNTAIVFGRRHEKFPDKSLYNRICDIEWGGAPGEADACGGDFLCKTKAFVNVGGFDEQLIAGEEPDMCHRMKKLGWSIYRLSDSMSLHDAAIYSFSQWAKRSRRSGYAYARRCRKHFFDGSRYCWRENIRISFWGWMLPLFTVVLTVILGPISLILLLAYPLQYLRLLRQSSKNQSATYVLFLLVGNFTEALGQFQFLWRASMKLDEKIIEYK